SRLNDFINYDTQYGDARGNVYNAQGRTDWSAGWKGGLVWMNGGLFATRAVNNSFAVVSTDGVAGVPVSLFNNKVGHTNRKGLLLVPNLSAYQENTLDIDITDLPPNMAAERARILAVPSERSGVNVNFRLNRMQAASMVLKSTDGQFIPAGAVIRRSDGIPAAVVGFDGQTFIENLAAGENRFSIALPDESECRFSANYQTGPHQADLPDLGEIICTK
ncbi:fimbria/pilus outer membrane usher protein, partial [Neisseria dentiae]|uniref:fimbria/pilus outer membrane usher protein n=1 Tax=Neisseria dentiae TaxID=194197 RepID=UPI0035A14E09